MPFYVYQSLEDAERRFEFKQSIHDAAFTEHPESGEPIRRIIVPGVVVHQRGIKKSTKVNKKSAAATACGCASTAVLNSLGMGKTTPRYGEVTPMSHAGHHHGHSHNHAHSHSHGGGACHGHSHGHSHSKPK